VFHQHLQPNLELHHSQFQEHLETWISPSFVRTIDRNCPLWRLQIRRELWWGCTLICHCFLIKDSMQNSNHNWALLYQICWNNIERDEVLELKARIGKSRIAFIHKGEKTIYTKGGYFQCKQQHVTT
jgi:hypothetical protein